MKTDETTDTGPATAASPTDKPALGEDRDAASRVALPLQASPADILPPRSADTMSDAIAISSPNGRMSKRAKAALVERLRRALFGDGLPHPGLPPQPSEREKLLQHAARLRDLAARGMRPRAFIRDAEALERQAAALSAALAEASA